MLNYASNPSLYDPVTAAANVALAIQALIDDGGRNFIVPESDLECCRSNITGRSNGMDGSV